MKLVRNRFGDYVAGSVTIIAPRFSRQWTVTVKGEPRAQARTLREAIKTAEQESATHETKPS